MPRPVEKTLGWSGPQPLGQGFAVGSMATPELGARLLTPARLLDVIMRRSLSAPQVNTYLTTNDAAGFNLHWDDHDVIIVQLGGEKSWEVRGLSRPAPMYRDAERNDEPSEEIVWSGTLTAGDVMHIPAATGTRPPVPTRARASACTPRSGS